MSNFIQMNFLRNNLNYLGFDLHFINNNLKISFIFRKQISNLSYFGIMYTILLLKSRFTDQLHSLHFWVVLFPNIEVMKFFFCNFFGNKKKIIAILSYRVTGFSRHVIQFNDLKSRKYVNLDKPWKICLPYFFVLFLKSYQMVQ